MAADRHIERHAPADARRLASENAMASMWRLTDRAVVLEHGEQQSVAIVLSLIDHTRRGYRPKNALLAPAESGELRAQPVAIKVQALPGLLIYRFTHSMYYANAEQLSHEITELANNARPPLHWLCIDAFAVDDVDFSAAETPRLVFGILKHKGIRLVVAQVIEDVKEESGHQLAQLFGEDAFYDTIEDVLDADGRQVGVGPTPNASAFGDGKARGR